MFRQFEAFEADITDQMLQCLYYRLMLSVCAIMPAVSKQISPTTTVFHPPYTMDMDWNRESEIEAKLHTLLIIPVYIYQELIREKH